MRLTPDTNQHIRDLADDVLKQFHRTAAVARERLGDAQADPSGSLASVNTLTDNSALRRLERIGDVNRECYALLQHEPAVARVVVEDEAGQRHTYYICRSAQGLAGIGVISYRAPLGRIASLPIDEEFERPDGKVVTVVERAYLHPEELPDGWESYNSLLEGERYGPLTVVSMRALLGAAPDWVSGDALLEQLLAEEEAQTNLIEGRRRGVITKMALRDQPILDKYQDEIFRLPIDRRLLLLGPPGTGKTTTLIRRLGQKLETETLDEREQLLIDSMTGSTLVDGWVMFTPTELLKQYLKEAFARERIAASDRHIRTWDEFRHELARSAFGVLRSGSGKGSLVIKSQPGLLTAEAVTHPTAWFDAFDDWRRDTYLNDLRKAAEQLANSEDGKAGDLGHRAQTILDRARSDQMPATLAALVAEDPVFRTFVNEHKTKTDRDIRSSLVLQINRDNEFLDALGGFLDTLEPEAQDDDIDATDDEVNEEEDTVSTSTPRATAMQAYQRAVRTLCGAAVSGRAPRETTQTGKLVAWLGDRVPSKEAQLEIGRSLKLQAAARRFLNPVRRLLGAVPGQYRTFRRQMLKEGRWYAATPAMPHHVDPLELDLVLLALLRSSSELLARKQVLRDVREPAWQALTPVHDRLHSQVLVDEATDFSPVQLACMAALAHPNMRSYFACGDFHQRLTTWGSRTMADLEWVYGDFELREVTTSYRQSRTLIELARAIIRTVEGKEQAIGLPDYVDGDGVPPALLERASRHEAITWLSARIVEIERFLGQLPSTAIFVPSEEYVVAVADALQAELDEHNIIVSACHEGQTIGSESSVRVFDIQHIKGLEFEAAFILSLDRLAATHPDIFDKYLYVGTTRAATYLGVTCDAGLPASISSLRDHFVTDWNGMD